MNGKQRVEINGRYGDLLAYHTMKTRGNYTVPDGNENVFETRVAVDVRWDDGTVERWMALEPENVKRFVFKTSPQEDSVYYIGPGVRIDTPPPPLELAPGSLTSVRGPLLPVRAGE